MGSWRVSPAVFPSWGVQLAPSELLHGREQTMVNMEGWEICFNRTPIPARVLLQTCSFCSFLQA